MVSTAVAWAASSPRVSATGGIFAVPMVSQMRRASPTKEFELYRQPDLRLVVLVDMARRGVELARAHGRAAMDEDALPRDLHIVEPDQPVILVEARGERVVETGKRAALV